jgi:hypothetical protein
MQRRFNVGISISLTDEKRRLAVFGATPTRKKVTYSYVQSHFLSDTLAAEQCSRHKLMMAIQPLKALPLCITRQRKQYNL